MLGFILSKLNLLILVVAIFAIVAFFSFGLSEIIKVRETELIISRVTKSAQDVVNSPAHCDSSYYYLPKAIEVSGSSFYYVVKISKGTLQLNDGSSTNVLIFSAFSRKNQKNSIAADSFRTNAAIHIFSKDYDGEEYADPIQDMCDSAGEECAALLDPQARGKQDAIVLVKEIAAGQPILYVIPCNSEGPLCEATKEIVGCIVRGYNDFQQCQQEGAGFNC